MFWIFFGILLLAFAGAAGWLNEKYAEGAVPGFGLTIIRVVLIIIGLWGFASTSYVNVGPNEIATLTKHYGWSNLEGEHIIATDGQKGPQAETMPPGFHFSLFINVLYDVEKVPVEVIAPGEYGFLTALDGVPLKPDQFLADQFPTGHETDMLDVQYFLTHGGQRGPQSSTLPPGTYRLSNLLWKLERSKAIDIAPGEVGVVKSNFIGAVNFGTLSAPAPKDCYQKTVSTNDKGETIQAAADPGKLTAILVPVGCIGVWEKPLQPGRYYVNEHAYTITKISTLVQTWEFKGGYKKRYIDLKVDQQGTLTQTERSEDVPMPPGSADRAVIPRIEGWEVPQELRVLAQITPDNAPFVVAAVGGLKQVEDNIMVPTIRSIVRNVLGAEGRHVLDLADNRALMERLVEEAIRPEGLRAGIVIKEVKFGDPALPPELLVSRLRQQLASQLQDTYKQEKLAQDMRISTEQARATADQQADLVRAQIGVQVATQTKTKLQLEGEGQKLQLEQIAQGQLAQANVLGQDRVMMLTMMDKLLTTLKDKPELVALVGRMVPVTSVTVGGTDGGGLSGAAAIFGAMMHAAQTGTPPGHTTAPAALPQQK
jgi:regulator of protease activity HflC (stomatin/prohibitin superfamily)